MIRRLILTSLLIAVSITVNANEKAKLDNLLNEIWLFELSINPVNATSLGHHDNDDKLADISPAGLKARNKSFEGYYERLKSIDVKRLDRTSQINAMMQEYRLKNYIDQYRFNAHFMPLTSESGFHSSLASLPRRVRFSSVQDFDNYLTRLAQFPAYFEQQISWMRKGMETGKVQPKVVMQGFEESVASYFQTSVEESGFYAPFKQIRIKITDEQRESLQAKGKQAVEGQVFAAYRKFYEFLVDEYIPGAKDNIAATTWKKGTEYYQNRSNYYTTTDLSADEIHQIGLKEVARIRSEMQAIIDELEFDGNINAFIKYLRTEPRFYAKSAKELLKHASYYAKLMDAKLPQLFYKLPRTPYGVAPVPDNIAPKYTTGRYVGPTRDDQPGYYWVNTYALDKRPLYAIPALTLHEAVPGHHLQNALAREMEALPPVRRYTYISAFGEGWGLYSEFLGKEVGIYQDAFDEFGRLSYEMWRACRLVVDTGMHTKGWSRQKALDYMLENTALSEHNVRTEIDRYISWPAQALSYKIGEIEIKNLRREAEQALGEKFDIRAFHDAILEHGSVPLSVLRENIQHFIEQHKSEDSN